MLPGGCSLLHIFVAILAVGWVGVHLQVVQEADFLY